MKKSNSLLSLLQKDGVTVQEPTVCAVSHTLAVGYVHRMLIKMLNQIEYKCPACLKYFCWATGCFEPYQILYIQCLMSGAINRQIKLPIGRQHRPPKAMA